MTETVAAPPLPVVIVDAEAPTDAALVQTVGGGELLVLRKDQSFSNAVTQISRLLPEIHPDRVRAAVRVHLPDAVDFDTLESSSRSAISLPVELAPPVGAPEKRRSVFRRALVHGGLASIITLTGMAYLLGSSDGPDPYDIDAFQRFTQAGRLMCSPIDIEHAQCTDSDGTVMLSTVVTSSDFTAFTFTYGTEKVVMRVFPTVEAAAEWIREGGTRHVFANVTQAGRYVFYGSDKARIDSYAEMVRTGAGKRAQDPAAAPPPRLAGLAFGALNLPGADQIQLVSASQERAVRALLGAPARPVDAGPAVLVSADPAVTFTVPPPLHGVVAPVVDGLADLVDDVEVVEGPIQRAVAASPAPRPVAPTVTVTVPSVVTVTAPAPAPVKRPAPSATTPPAPSSTTPPVATPSQTPSPAPSTVAPTPAPTESAEPTGTPTDPASDPVSDGAGGGLTADAAPAGDRAGMDVTVGGASLSVGS